jgi:hypothetical protein
MPAAELTEQLADWNLASQIDRDQCVVRNVALSGNVSKNGYRYSDKALSRAVPLYAERPVFLDHAGDPQRSRDRSTRDLVGSVCNPRFESGRIRGDIRVLDTEAVRTFLSLAASASPGLGMSHVVLARRSADGSVVEQIEDVISVDAVVNPATTTTFHEQSAGQVLDHGAVETLEEITRERDDLRQRVTTLQAEIERLRPFESQLYELRQDQAVQRLLSASQLPAEMVSEEFRQLLRSAPDDEFRRALIADRRWLVEQGRPRATLSLDRAQRGDTGSDRAFVNAVRRK